MRDNDKSKVYSAEQHVRRLLETPGVPINMVGTTVVTPDERKFGRVEDVQAYVDKVLAHIGMSDVPVSVRVRKGQLFAHYNRARQEIAIPDGTDWALREMVVLHELAHHLTPFGLNVTSHGPEFRSVFCDLLEKVLAPEARFLLQMSFWDMGLTA